MPHTKRKNPWFKKVRGSYLPASWQGWLTYVPFVAYLVAVLVDALRHQPSVSSAVYMIFPQWVAATAVMTWIAWRKS
jgi:hypothetical protein